MKTVSIVYSSVGGNTKLVCDMVQQTLQLEHIEVEMIECQTANLTSLSPRDIIILACPTYGQGTIETDFSAFLALISSQNWSNQAFAVIGLGDIKYYPEYLTEAAGLLAQWVTDQQGKLIVPPLRLGQPPLKFLNSMVKKWAEKLAEEILNQPQI